MMFKQGDQVLVVLGPQEAEAAGLDWAVPDELFPEALAALEASDRA